MKRILSFCMLLLMALAAQAQDAKYTVTLNVPEDGTLSAYAGIKSGDYISQRSEFAAGEEVHLTGSLKAEYSSTGWTDENGTLVCDSLHYIFTMPARNVVLTGHTTYDPANPPGPREDGYTDTWNRLYLRSNPEYGGAFTWGLGAESAQNWLVWTGYEFTVQAYPATGFKFAGWQLDGETVSTDNPYTFTMPERDMTLYAMYDYDPETPANPHGNVWNKESGELIMSDFTPGKLEDEINEVTRRDPWNSDWSLIKSAIVDGPCLQEGDGWATFSDWEAFRYASNVEYLDYSRSSGLTFIPSYCFNGKEKLTTIVLPATTDSIGPLAFADCKGLTTVTSFATTPPVLGGLMPGEQSYDLGSYSEYSWPFNGLNADNIIVHVPAESMPLYQAARGWKEFIIQPIAQGISRLTVNLPQADTYKDMFLELVNTKTLQAIRYVVTPATTYTFNNLIHGTSYNLYLKNQRGSVLGTIEGIDIEDKDVQVSFADLKMPIDITLRLLAPDGTDVTPLGGAGGAVTWTDRQGNYLGSGTTLEAQAEGSQVRFHVKPDEALGRQYLMPQDSLVTVGRMGDVEIRLTPFPQTTIGGTVSAASTGSPVRSATVTVSQLLNGLYAASQTVRTDVQGHWTTTAYQAPTTVTISHNSYLKTSATLTAEEMAGAPTVDSQLKDLSGTVVELDLYYRAAIHDGEESISEDYTDAANVAFSVYDVTHQTELTQLSVQYPLLVLADQELTEGTRLRVTATSLNKTFMPVTAECTVDGQGHATATLPIVEMGKIEASFEMTDNESVVALLFNEEEQLVGWASYKGVSLTVANIPDGRYRLITLGGGSMLSTSFNTFWALDNIGMREGADYVQNIIDVKSGKISVVKNQLIPHLDETAFLYTGSQTNFSVNKQEVTVGQYVTVKGQVDFKAGYVAENVQLMFDLPEGCQLVDGSVMVGNHTASYLYYDNRVRLDVPAGEPVRFCIVPLTGGTFQASATVSADLNGINTRQPIGQAIFTATDLTINVPPTTGRRLLPATGMAVPLSKVEVYDNDVLIAETTSLGTGYWSVLCPLDRPYNLSDHSIYAIVTTPEGLQMQSETKTVTVDRGHLTPVVTMQLIGTKTEHHKKQFVFDFRTNEVSPAGMKLTGFGDFNLDFHVDFYDENNMLVNDTTVVRNVTLYTLGERGNVDTYPLKYNERYKCWYQLVDKNVSNMPVNVDLDYTVAGDMAADRQLIDDIIAEGENYLEESRREYLDVHHAFDDEIILNDQAERDELMQLLQIEEPDESQIQRTEQLMRLIVGDSIMDDAAAKYHIDLSEVHAITSQPNLTIDQLDQACDLLDNIVAQWNAEHPVTPEDIDAELARIDQLLAEVDIITGEARDTLLSIMPLFWCPDTTLTKMPDGDIEFTHQFGDDQYCVFTQKKLTSINEGQLLAEGYTAMPTTDGSIIYCLREERKACYIDTKSMRMYAQEIVNSEQARARGFIKNNAAEVEVNPVNAVLQFFPSHCVAEFSNFVDKCSAFIKEVSGGTDAIGFFTGLADIILSGSSGLECLYNAGVEKVEEFLESNYAKVSQKLRDKSTKLLNEKQELDRKLAKAMEDNKRDRLLQQDYSDRIAEYEAKLKTEGIGRAERDRCERGIVRCKAKKAELRVQMSERSTNISKWNNSLNGLTKKMEKMKKALGNLADKFKNMREQISKHLPKNLKPLEKLYAKVDGLLKTPPLKLLFEAGPFLNSLFTSAKDISKWVKLYQACLAKIPCEGNETAAQQLVADCETFAWKHAITNGGKIALDGGNLVLSAKPSIPLVDWTWWVSKAVDLFATVYSSWQNKESEKDQKTIQDRLDALKCDPDPDDDDGNKDNNPSGTLPNGGNNSDDSNSGGIKITWNFFNLWFVRDPAGYVYEAVNSNRVEGVRTTCYYKETKEDMYGDLHDEAVVWDAERYAQENPLFTDADGRYQWDVPTGLWQVKYEKQGYETTYSDWLPVPPPQLEVNVGITQMKQPNVQKVKAYADGIDITFDKYMRPHTLTNTSVSVVKNGQVVAGKLEMLNAESGYQTPDSMYASKMRLSFNNNLSAGDKVTLTVKRTVESYAGLQMEQDFQQQFSVEQRVEQLVVDTLVNMSEEKELTLTVRALPAEAARGKHLTVATSAPDVATLFPTEPLTLDERGEARLTVASQGQGTSVLRFALMEDEDVKASTIVTVRDPSTMVVARPRSSRLNGVTMYIGSEIRLSCATSGATIRYTLDGSCPCEPQSGSVLTYDGPIVLTSPELTIKAMAVAPGMEDSPVVEFSYKGKERPTAIEAPTVSDGSPVGEQPKVYFRLDGRRISRPERGINIEREKSGTVKKVAIK